MHKQRKKLSRFIKAQDMFGHQFQLGFNGKGNLQTTLSGGFISVMLNLLILAFFILKFINVVTYSDDLIQLSSSYFDPKN